MTKKSIYASAALDLLKWGASPLPLEAYNAQQPDSSKPKKPTMKNWQQYCEILMSEDMVQQFSRNQPQNNIGVALGILLRSGKRLAAIDIDDERVVQFVKAVIGKPIVCSKRGKKGLTIYASISATRRARNSTRSTISKPR